MNTSLRLLSLLSLAASLSIACGGGSDGNGDGDGDGATGATNGDGDAATGGMNGDGDGTGGTATGGESGGDTGGSNGCVPKTCEEIALELGGDADAGPGEEGSACGDFDDGCGGTVTCDPCDAEGFECGAERNKASDLTYDTGHDGIEGVCGGGCRTQDDRYRNQICGVDQAVTGVSCALRATPEYAGAQTGLTCTAVPGNSWAFCCQ